MTIKLRRSILYMPGSNERALEKAKSLPADGLILDLEDAVAPDHKNHARSLVAKMVAQKEYGAREVIIRINALDTSEGQEDLKMAVAARPDAILLPKVSSGDMVKELERKMVEHGADESLKIWCMMETPRGMLRAEEIAGASKRITAFVMGTSDLVKDLHASHTKMRLPVLTSLGLCMLAARAENIAIIDGVYLDLNDEKGYAFSCQLGLEMGFDGKSLIHPKQIASANEVFAPTAEEIEFSKRIIAASEKATKEGKAVVLVDGKLIEYLHVEDAKRLIKLDDMRKDKL